MEMLALSAAAVFNDGALGNTVAASMQLLFLMQLLTSVQLSFLLPKLSVVILLFLIQFFPLMRMLLH